MFRRSISLISGCELRFSFCSNSKRNLQLGSHDPRSRASDLGRHKETSHLFVQCCVVEMHLGHISVILLHLCLQKEVSSASDLRALSKIIGLEFVLFITFAADSW